MSAQQLQHAIAHLIRRPESNRGSELEAFIQRFELTPHEDSQVRALAADPSVTKYGRIMGASRERKVTNLIKLSQSYMEKGLLTRVWKQHFEPQAIHVRFNELPFSFLKFLLEDKHTHDLLKREGPPFLPDMLHFELAQAYFRMKHFTAQRNVPEGSCLAHGHFILLRLGYDIQGLRARLIKEKQEAGKLVPEPRQIKNLFLRKSAAFDCRIYEVDEEVASFLEGQLDIPLRALPRPASYDMLVQLGLCRPLN